MHGARIDARVGKHLGTAPAFSLADRAKTCVDHSPCGPLMPRTESRKSPPPSRPSRCDVRKPFRVSLGDIGDEPATEAPHLFNRGSHFGGVYPPKSPLLGLSRSWQQDTETPLIMLQGDPKYPPHKLPTHVPTRAVLRTWCARRFLFWSY